MGGQHGNPLQAAASQGHAEIVRLLLEQGADANTLSGEHDSPLQVATSEGHAEIVRLLLDAGADLNLRGCYDTNVTDGEMERSSGHR
jgi:ankyrin repeat protein